MIHSFALIAFTLVFCRWLSFEFKKPVDFRKHRGWLVAVFVVPLIASAYNLTNQTIFGNFVLHAVGGGVATALVFEYLLRQYKLKVNWRVELGLLFALVSSLGVINEILEFAADSLNWDIFSYSRLDTWRDLCANTLGAVLCWLVLKVFTRKKKIK